LPCTIRSARSPSLCSNKKSAGAAT